MPVDPPRKITETQIIRREENTNMHQRKKPSPHKKDQDRKDQEKSGIVDIKV